MEEKGLDFVVKKWDRPDIDVITDPQDYEILEERMYSFEHQAFILTDKLVRDSGIKNFRDILVLIASKNISLVNKVPFSILNDPVECDFSINLIKSENYQNRKE